MRISITAIITLLLCSTVCNAQYSLFSANGNSGVIVEDGKSNLNYDVSKSRIGFTYYFREYLDSSDDPSGAAVILDLFEIDIDLGFSAHNGRKNLFKGGKFTPGVDAASTFSYTKERRNIKGEQIPGYHLLFFRFVFDVVERKVARFIDESTNVFETDTDAEFSVGAGLGYNISLCKENMVLGVSGTARYNWNSAYGKKEQTVCVTKETGVDQKGNTITISDCSERFFGNLPDQVTSEVRFDMFYNILYFSDAKESSSLGVIGAVSVKYGQKTDKFSYNASIGPSIQPPGLPFQVVVAALLELIDIGNSLGDSPKFTDQFGVTLYVGVPFSILKKLI